MPDQSESAGCAPEAGRVVPTIDPARCEGKSDCVRVCPYGVFEVRRLEAGELGKLGRLARLKLFFHGNKQAFAIHADLCQACGLCVEACPERAIKLVPAGSHA